jgi:hypothetical protein
MNMFMGFRESMSQHITTQEEHLLRAYKRVLRNIFAPRTKYRPSGKARSLTF